ncbi:restriction endonuclease subunit S [Citrobacter sp. EBS8]
MGSNAITTIGEHLQIRNGKSSPSRTETGEYPVYGSNGIIGYSDEYNANENTIIIGRVGSYCGSVYISDNKCWVTDNAIIGTAKNKDESHFWFYLLKKIDLNNYRTGSGQPLLNQTIINAISVTIPSLSEKRISIGYFIRNFDQKINLSFEVNQTLEQMSQTLFKSWFVDFDPVIDNALDAGNPIPEALQSRAELRQKVRNSADFKPLPADIRALFPAEFEETELGWVPKGWKGGSIPDIAFINSTSWGTKNQPDYVNYVDLSNAKDGIISSIEEIPFKDAPSRARRILKKDDLIFGLVRPANRSFAYVHVDGLTGSTGFAVIRAKNTIYKNFIYYFVTYDKNIEELARIADGGAYPAIKPDDICSLPLIIPPEEIVQRFDESTSNFRHLMNNSLVQNVHLTALRDTLLPKLISGELSLEDLPDLVTQTEPA